MATNELEACSENLVVSDGSICFVMPSILMSSLNYVQTTSDGRHDTSKDCHPWPQLFFCLSLLLAVERTVIFCPAGMVSMLILLIDGELMFEDAAKVWASLLLEKFWKLGLCLC